MDELNLKDDFYSLSLSFSGYVGVNKKVPSAGTYNDIEINLHTK